MKYFPPGITPTVVKALGLLRDRLAEDPTYLDDSKYSAETISQLKEILIVPNKPGPVKVDFDDIKIPDGDPLDLSEELDKLYKYLRAVRPEDGAETKEQVSYARTAVNLLGQLVTLKERAVRIDNVVEFRKIVLDIIGQYLAPEEITDLTNRLKTCS